MAGISDDLFTEKLAEMTQTLWNIASTQLRSHYDREDALQEAVTKAWGNRHKLRELRHMKTWVVRILINECRNIQRKQGREVVSNASTVETADANGLPDIALREALYVLDSKLRLPVVLCYVEGYTTAEAAKILRIPKGTLLWRLSKARGILSETLNGKDK